jgi:hypothetical protein
VKNLRLAQGWNCHQSLDASSSRMLRKKSHISIHQND